MAQTIEISNSEFKAHQGAYVDKALNEGIHIIIRRRGKSAFTVTPVEEEEEKKLSPELIAVIERGLKSRAEGRGTAYRSLEEFKKRLGL